VGYVRTFLSKQSISRRRFIARDGKESRILIRDTWNTDIVPELKPQPDDDVIYKTRFSGFFGTDLTRASRSWA
jgi:ureidoacrylate peracid hydrolase